jgi:hypothetical protein
LLERFPAIPYCTVFKTRDLPTKIPLGMLTDSGADPAIHHGITIAVIYHQEKLLRDGLHYKSKEIPACETSTLFISS